MEEANKSPFSSNVDKPEKDAIKLFSGVVILAVLAIIVGLITKDGRNFLLGLVNPADTVDISISLTSISGADEVEPGVYGIHMAKLLDEAGVAENWLSYTTDFAGEIEANNARFFAGGEVSYYHFKTTFMEPGRLLPEEITALVGGNEIRGNGFIKADRIDAEAGGNTGELSEITEVKPRYGNLSYLEGFQNTKPHNFIRDYVDILEAGNSDSVFVLNLRYSSPEEELEKIDFLIDQGVNITGIECGNEAYAKTHQWYHAGNPTVNAPISVEEYLDTCDEYRSLILAEHPGIPFAVSAAPKKNFEEGADWEDSDFNEEWNMALKTKMDEHNYDDYVIHFYAPFNSCEDEVAGGNRDSIFSCGLEEMRDLRNTVAGPNLTTRFPVILDWYRETFPGKNMWFTEWNINQDPANGTDAKYANSILHAAFVTNILNMINEENATNGNYIKIANLHTFMTDGGNAMINLHTSKGVGNSEPEDTGDFVRRTPYFAYLSMKDIFKEGYTPLATTFTLSSPSNQEDITVYGYRKDDGEIALSVSNLTGKTLRISSITVDGEVVDLTNSSGSLYAIDGDANYSSRGKTEFAVNPGYEVTIRDEDYSSLETTYIPSFGISTLKLDPTFVEVILPTEEDDDCGILGGIFGNCDENTEETDNVPPKVSFSTPENGAILSGESTQIQIQSTDKNGVERVDLYQGKTLIGTDSSLPYKYVWDISELSNGPYTLRAVSYDLAGNSASVQIKVAKSN